MVYRCSSELTKQKQQYTSIERTSEQASDKNDRQRIR